MQAGGVNGTGGRIRRLKYSELRCLLGSSGLGSDTKKKIQGMIAIFFFLLQLTGLCSPVDTSG